MQLCHVPSETTILGNFNCLDLSCCNSYHICFKERKRGGRGGRKTAIRFLSRGFNSICLAVPTVDLSLLIAFSMGLPKKSHTFLFHLARFESIATAICFKDLIFFLLATPYERLILFAGNCLMSSMELCLVC